jgi:hypothetical protein
MSDSPRETGSKLDNFTRASTTFCGLAYYSLEICYPYAHYRGQMMIIVEVSVIIGTEEAASRTNAMTFGD